MNAIRFHYIDQRFPFPHRTELKQFLLELAREEGHDVEGINYIFCGDAYLLEINQNHLKHDTYTDIITFPYSPPGAALLSDIYISIDRVRENAGVFNTPFKTELLRVIFHGLLHLCGWKDKTKGQKQEMREREDYWIDAFVKFHVKR